MVDPEEWSRGTVKKIQCMEVFSSPELYTKIHRDVLSSFASDVASLPENKPEMSFDAIDENQFQKFVEQIKTAQWQQGSSIGNEVREETISAKEVFGESVCLQDEVVHLMCALH
jgi:hypothetical protein